MMTSSCWSNIFLVTRSWCPMMIRNECRRWLPSHRHDSLRERAWETVEWERPSRRFRRSAKRTRFRANKFTSNRRSRWKRPLRFPVSLLCTPLVPWKRYGIFSWNSSTFFSQQKTKMFLLQKIAHDSSAPNPNLTSSFTTIVSTRARLKVEVHRSGSGSGVCSTSNSNANTNVRHFIDWLIDWLNSTQNPEATGKQQSVVANYWWLLLSRVISVPLWTLYDVFFSDFFRGCSFFHEVFRLLLSWLLFHAIIPLLFLQCFLAFLSFLFRPDTSPRSHRLTGLFESWNLHRWAPGFSV